MCGISTSFGIKNALPIEKLAHQDPDQFVRLNREWIYAELT